MWEALATSCKLLIINGGQRRDRTARRRPFQGPLPTDLSALESADAIDTKDVRQHRFRIVWDHLGWFPPRLFPYCSRPSVRPLAVPSSGLPTLRVFDSMLPQLSVDRPDTERIGTQVARGAKLLLQ